MSRSTAAALFAWAAVLLAALAAGVVEARLREGECQVCIGVLDKVAATLQEGKSGDAHVYEKALKDYCRTSTGRENRFCYYIGATEDAASSILKDVVKPASSGVPHELLCERLKKRDPLICELRYESSDTALDWKTADLHKLRVRDLKKIANEIKAECYKCSEKSDYIEVIEAARAAAGIKNKDSL